MEYGRKASAADTELAAVAAADELAYGSLEAAERYLGLAERRSASVPDARHGQAQLLLGIARLLAARQRGNLLAVTDEAQRLQAMAEAPEAAQCDLAPATRAALGEDLHALALISLGDTEYWTVRFEDASRHLERGIALARRIGRPYLEFTGLAHRAAAQLYHSYARAAECGRQAVEPQYVARPPSRPEPLPEPLSDSEIRVLRYLPTNLSGPEIAGELYVSHNTVRTHIRHLYAKLGTHRRTDTVARARALGLLAPSPHRGQATRARLRAGAGRIRAAGSRASRRAR